MVFVYKSLFFDFLLFRGIKSGNREGITAFGKLIGFFSCIEIKGSNSKKGNLLIEFLLCVVIF